MATTAPPTTLPPTTLAPTTLAPTTLAPTTPPPVEIECGPIEISVSLISVLHLWPAAARDVTLDRTYLVNPIVISLSVHGAPANVGIGVNPIIITLEQTGKFLTGLVLPTGIITIEIKLPVTNVVFEHFKKNWVKWSKIGHLDFTIDASNVAGERPMDWKGWVYGIKKLVDKIAVYGQNGVSIMKPNGVYYGLDTIHPIGIMGKGAFTGTDKAHFFIDTLGQLFMLTASDLVKLDYSEYLSVLSSPVMSLDVEKELIYICDGTVGYIYGIRSGSFGTGPINITGIGAQAGNLYVAAPSIISTPKFEICTDTYDLETRKPKTITVIEVGCNLSQHLHVSVDYRKANNEAFRRIPWYLVNPDGRSYPKCYGLEFRFRLRSFIYESFKIDYIKVHGHIHGFLDTTSSLGLNAMKYTTGRLGN